MPRIDISIAGRSFPVSCADGEEARVAAIAGQIDQRISEMRRSVTTATDMHLLVMTSLMMGDEMIDLRVQLDRVSAGDPAAIADGAGVGAEAAPDGGSADLDEAEVVRTIGHVADRIEALADALAEV